MSVPSTKSDTNSSYREILITVQPDGETSSSARLGHAFMGRERGFGLEPADGSAVRDTRVTVN